MGLFDGEGYDKDCYNYNDYNHYHIAEERQDELSQLRIENAALRNAVSTLKEILDSISSSAAEGKIVIPSSAEWEWI